MKIIIQTSEDFIKINQDVYSEPCHTSKMEPLDGALVGNRQLYSRKGSSYMFEGVLNKNEICKAKSVYYEQNAKNLKRH